VLEKARINIKIIVVFRVLLEQCYDLKLELRLHLGKDLREVKENDINGKA